MSEAMNKPLIERLTEEDFLRLKNDEERKAFLETWPTWSIWGCCPTIGLRVHRILLPCNVAITAAVYDVFANFYKNGEHCLFNWTCADLGFSPNAWIMNNLLQEMKELKRKLKEGEKGSK